MVYEGHIFSRVYQITTDVHVMLKYKHTIVKSQSKNPKNCPGTFYGHNMNVTVGFVWSRARGKGVSIPRQGG